MFKTSNVVDAEQLAIEHDLLSGFSTLDGQWYVGTKEELSNIGVLDDALCFYACTRGKKHEVTVTRGLTNRYVMECFTSNKSTMTASGYTRKEIQKRVVDEVFYANQYDNINYKIKLDDLDIGKLLNIIYERKEQ